MYPWRGSAFLSKHVPIGCNWAQILGHVFIEEQGVRDLGRLWLRRAPQYPSSRLDELSRWPRLREPGSEEHVRDSPILISCRGLCSSLLIHECHMFRLKDGTRVWEKADGGREPRVTSEIPTRVALNSRLRFQRSTLDPLTVESCSTSADGLLISQYCLNRTLRTSDQSLHRV